MFIAWNKYQGQSSKLQSWLSHVFPRAPPFSSQPLFQEKSHLLSRLPLEVRHQLYVEVLESFGTLQHVILSNKKLAHVRCALPETHVYFQTTWKGGGHPCYIYENCVMQSAWDGWGIISLLLSCRQM
ncbi:hypothetical protein DL95DRAFT_56994 [Leptodontidium sp. 2 PMI_412]|nr:hypothetical protein DL95DRAFT_56994 [Leptodontidium sp. 2 PMI_412]